VRLADVTSHVDSLISKLEIGIVPIMTKLTAESPYVVALFEGSDPEGMEIYRELGFTAEIQPGSWTVMDILEQPLEEAYRKHNYAPIDELAGSVPRTVQLFVFTMGVVVVRRFEKGEGPITKLREVKLTRDIELRSTLTLNGPAALEVIGQKCAPMLRRLWDAGSDRVGYIQWASHGAKVGFIDRKAAARGFRENAAQSSRDSSHLLRLAEALDVGPQPGELPVVFNGWGAHTLLKLDTRSFTAGKGIREVGPREEDVIHERIVACRDQKRALGIFEKCLDKIGASSPASASLAELVALLRHSWRDCGAISAQIAIVQQDAYRLGPTGAGDRLRGALLALTQATIERRQGGALNTPGGTA